MLSEHLDRMESNMKKYAIIFSVLALMACDVKEGPKPIGDIGTVDDLGEVKPVQIPSLGEYGKKAGPLPPLSCETFECQQNDAIAADMAYNDVAHQLNTVITIYECVGDAVNNKKSNDEIAKCLGVE